MSKFILIENPGVASPASFTLLGASNKSGTDAIGQFGSGTKFGVLTLLRKGINPIIYCGNLCLSFSTKEIVFDGAAHRQLYVDVSGKDASGKQVKRHEDLSIVLRYGEIDWKDKTELALREFISNALDATNGDASQVSVKLVDTSPRAKSGTTRVYIPVTPEGENFVVDLAKWFLQFSEDKVWKHSSIIEKAELSPPRIYRRGVFVREVTNKVSLFDYNLNSLPLDEARLASDWDVKYYAEKALNRVATPKVLSRILATDKDVWEASFDLSSRYDYSLSNEEKETIKANWIKAQDELLDEKTIFAHETQDTTLAERKGYKIVRLNEERYNNVVAQGLRTVANVLSTDEREGRHVDAVTDPAAQKAVLHVWNVLVSIEAIRNAEYPQVKTYEEQMNGGSRTLGLYKDNTVYINKCLLSGDEISQELFAVCLEEIAHHVTKATDNSRDFQEYFIQTLVKVLR